MSLIVPRTVTVVGDDDVSFRPVGLISGQFRRTCCWAIPVRARPRRSKPRPVPIRTPFSSRRAASSGAALEHHPEWAGEDLVYRRTGRGTRWAARRWPASGSDPPTP